MYTSQIKGNNFPADNTRASLATLKDECLTKIRQKLCSNIQGNIRKAKILRTLDAN